MKTVFSVVTLALALIAAPASAAEEKKAEKAPSAQQNRMKDCNKDAGEKKLKGAERKSFMSTCLKGDGAKADTAAKAADSGCEAKAVSKSGKPLHGAAKTNSIKKCEAEAKPVAAKADAKPAEAKAEPKADAKPAAAKVEAKTEAKPAAAKVEPKADAKK